MTASLRLPPGYRLLDYDELDSTNDEAKRLGADGAPAGCVVWAKSQPNGRGRRGRRWDGPPGNLYMSLLLRPAHSPAAAAQLGFVAALAVGEACAPFLPEATKPRYKWPNDVLVSGRKVSGILLESSALPDGMLDWLVVGIGINVASHPAGTEFPATSLAASGGTATVTQLLESTVARYHHWMGRWEAAGFEAIREAWLSNAIGVGGKVTVRLERQVLEGRFADLDRDGALLLETDEGNRRVLAGDVFPVAAS